MENLIVFKQRETSVPLPDAWQTKLSRTPSKLWAEWSWSQKNMALCYEYFDDGLDPDEIDAAIRTSDNYSDQWTRPCCQNNWDPSYHGGVQTCGETTINHVIESHKDDGDEFEVPRALAVIKEAYDSFCYHKEIDNVDEIRWALNFLSDVHELLGNDRPIFGYVNSCMNERQMEVEDISLAGWSDPAPFDDYSNLPTFPSKSIPGPCGDMVEAVATSCQVDSGLPGSMVLATLSTAVGGKIKVDLGTHQEPGNLFLTGILGSGNRKTGVTNHTSEPVYAFQRERQVAMALTIREALSKMRILEKRLERLQKDAASKDDALEREPIIKLCNEVLAEIADNPVPKNPVFLVDDITPEALGQVMADNWERMAIISAEGGIVKIISGLYSSGQANYDLFLKAHAGDPWANNRIGRESKMMSNPALTMGLAVQPNVIEEMGKNPEFRERGLSARFLYALCQSRAGYRTRQSTPVPPHIKLAYNRRITDLMAFEGACVLRLSPEAQALWDEFYDEIELSLRPGGNLEHLVDWGSKLPGAVARISGLLHCADYADGFRANPIQESTVRAACEIGRYYLDHAKAVFGMMKEDPTINVAKRILNYIRVHRPDELVGRDLFNHTNLQSMSDIQPGLNALVERGYIKELYTPTTHKGPGRPAATRYEINPKIFSNT